MMYHMSTDFGLAHLRDALDTLHRLREGWRPDECLLADARYLEQSSLALLVRE